MNTIKQTQTKNKRLIIILTVASLLLFIPWIAMQFTKEVDWKIFDFVIMSILLYGLGISCELMIRKMKSKKQKIILCSTLIIIFLLIWMELAVGIIGTPLAGN